MNKIPLLPYITQVLSSVYIPSSSNMYLNSNYENKEIDVSKPIYEKVNNIVESIRDNDKWLKPDYKNNINISLQRHRSGELHRQFRPYDPPYSELSKITTERKFFTNNRHEKELLKSIDSIDNEILLTSTII